MCNRRLLITDEEDNQCCQDHRNRNQHTFLEFESHNCQIKNFPFIICISDRRHKKRNKGFVTNSIYISVYIRTHSTLLLDVPSRTLQNKKSGFVMIPDFISIYLISLSYVQDSRTSPILITLSINSVPLPVIFLIKADPFRMLQVLALSSREYTSLTPALLH